MTNLHKKVLNNKEYLAIVDKIENIRFITDGKWDWEHGLGHYRRVLKYVEKILIQLAADDRTIELGKVAALLHDIGLSKGEKVDHAIESSKLFVNFIDINDVTKEELEILRQAIYDHSKGNDVKSLVGLALVLADKLDVTYHRTVNSSIQDKMNKEIQKINDVDIEIIDADLIVKYTTDVDFDVNVLKDWDKTITVPYKIAKYLNKNYIFLVNGESVNYEELIY